MRTNQMLRDVVDNCSFTMIPQINASGVQAFLGSLRSDGYAINSINHYLRAIKMFTRWLMRDHRNNEDRLSHLSTKNPATDRRRIRRPLSMQEFQWLLQATQQVKPIQMISGPDRVIVYILACYTGFLFLGAHCLKRRISNRCLLRNHPAQTASKKDGWPLGPSGCNHQDQFPFLSQISLFRFSQNTSL